MIENKPAPSNGLIHTETQAYQEVDGKLQPVGLKMYLTAPTIEDVRELIVLDSLQYGGQRVTYISRQVVKEAA